MLPNGKTLVINCPGTVPRLPIHVGALKRLWEEGIVPDTAIATSAGGFAISAVADWSEVAFRTAYDVIGNLTPGKIFTINATLKKKLIVLIGASIGLAVLAVLMHGLVSLPLKMFLGLLGLALLLIAEGDVGLALLRSQSLFSIEPLLSGPLRSLDFRTIFKSPMEIIVLAADMCEPGPVLFSNRDPQNNDPENPEHVDRWLNILRASSRLFGKFPFVTIDGRFLGDGEAWTDFPITQMKKFDRAIRLDYWAPLRPEPAPREWIADLTRSFDVQRDRTTRKKMDNYEYERRENPAFPEIFYVRASKELLAQLPNIQIQSFTVQDMQDSINIGYRIMDENMPALRAYLGLELRNENPA